MVQCDIFGDVVGTFSAPRALRKICHDISDFRTVDTSFAASGVGVSQAPT